MKDEDIQAVALKHGLPMVPPQTANAYPWAYAPHVMAFARDLVGEEWPKEHAFPPTPFPVHIHSKLGDLFARFDMQMYAVTFERRTISRIKAALGIADDDSAGPESILKAIKALVEAKPNANPVEDITNAQRYAIMQCWHALMGSERSEYVSIPQNVLKTIYDGFLSDKARAKKRGA
jgi:hypothetical protein